MRDRRHLRRQHQGGDKDRNPARCCACEQSKFHHTMRLEERNQKPLPPDYRFVLGSLKPAMLGFTP